MNHGLPIVLFLVLATSGVGRGKEYEFITNSGYVNGKAVVSKASARDLEESPEWDLTDGGKIPLDLGEAVTAAKSYLESQSKNKWEWVVERIRIERTRVGKFVYLINFNKNLVSGGGHPDVIVVVLMNGRVLPFEKKEHTGQP